MPCTRLSVSILIKRRRPGNSSYRWMSKTGQVKDKVIRLFESILKQLIEVERELSVREEPQDYGEPS